MARKKTEDEELVAFIGETISSESALLACSINLMRAGDVAKACADSETLLKVSKAWYDLARYLDGHEDDDKPAHFGFASLDIVGEAGIDSEDSENTVEIRKR